MASIENYLQELGEQEAQEEKTLQGVDNSDLTPIFKRFEKFLVQRYRMGEEEDLYDEACESLKGMKYSSKDVTIFSLMLKKYESSSNFVFLAGLFLSALINLSEEQNFEILTSDLIEKIWCMGIKNVKNITVKGCLGDGVGYSMKKGKIVIEGRAGYNLGFQASRGKIYVRDGIEDIAADCGATVYEGGELVWPK